MAVAILLLLFGQTELRFVGLMPALFSTGFTYRFLSKSAVVIFDDHVEFHQAGDVPTIVDFRDITSIEYRIRKNWANDYYITVDKEGKNDRILLPHVYQDVFDPLKKPIASWYSRVGPPGVVQDIADGSDSFTWKAPRWKLAQGSPS